jgi:hypothetical protein
LLPGFPGFHNLFDSRYESFCLLFEPLLSYVPICLTFLKKFIRDIQCGQDRDLDRIDTRTPICNLAHPAVNESRKLLQPRHVAIRAQSEPLSEDLDGSSNGCHRYSFPTSVYSIEAT